MKADYLPCVEVEAASPARSAVVWLHGLGADGHDFEPIVPELNLDKGLAARFVFPHAPSIPVTLNGGLVMPAWYDIRSPDLGEREDQTGIRESAEHARRLVDREVERGIASSRIVLGGFSQGGAVALHAALRYPDPLAGILVLSSYLVGGETLGHERSAANSGTPIFQAHGRFDPMVPVSRGEETRDLLSELGYRVSWKTYPMMHAVCREEIDDIGRWLGDVLRGSTKNKPDSGPARMEK